MRRVLRTEPEINNELILLDPVLKKLIDTCGPLEIELSTDYFSSLSSSIVGQQLSNKVAGIIWNRLVSLMGGELNPQKMLYIEDEKLREIGVSYSKIGYLKNLSSAVLNNKICLDDFEGMENDDNWYQPIGFIEGVKINGEDAETDILTLKTTKGTGLDRKLTLSKVTLEVDVEKDNNVNGINGSVTIKYGAKLFVKTKVTDESTTIYHYGINNGTLTLENGSVDFDLEYHGEGYFGLVSAIPSIEKNKGLYKIKGNWTHEAGGTDNPIELTFTVKNDTTLKAVDIVEADTVWSDGFDSTEITGSDSIDLTSGTATIYVKGNDGKYYEITINKE